MNGVFYQANLAKIIKKKMKEMTVAFYFKYKGRHIEIFKVTGRRGRYCGGFVRYWCLLPSKLWLKWSKRKWAGTGQVVVHWACYPVQQDECDPPWSCLLERIFPWELTKVVIPFPKSSLDGSINRVSFVHACILSHGLQGSWHSCPGWMSVNRKTHPACTVHKDGMYLPLWLN